MKPFLPLLVLHAGAAAAVAGSFTFHHENVLGTSFELRVEAGSEAAAEAAESRALAETDRLATVLSTWRKDSEINRWLSPAPGPMAVSRDLLAVLRACDHWESATGGAFNARAELLSGIWKRAAAEGNAPDAAELAAAVVRMKSPAWRIGEGTAERIGDCPVTVDALAKGYIIRMAGEAAREVPGVTSVLLNIGGDLQVWGREAHRIAIANPRADAENESSLRQMIEHRRMRGEHGRMPLRNVGGAGGELNVLGVANQRGQEQHAAGDVFGDFGEMLADKRVVEPQLVGENDGFAVFGQRLRAVAAHRMQRHGEIAQTHDVSPLDE